MRRIKWLAVTIAATLGCGIAALPAQARVAADTVISVTIKNKPDNGYGTPSHWADVTFVRTITVHPQTAPGTYEVTVKDAGTFTTRKNAGSPNNNVPIARKLKGVYSSTVHYGIVTGDLDMNEVGDLDENVYDVKAGIKPPSTGAWGKQLFKADATGGEISSYQFLYQTADEQWDERWNDCTPATLTTCDDRFGNNDDGQQVSAGDITGRLTAKLIAVNKCRVSKTDKRNRWLVTHVQGDMPRTFSYWIKYKGAYSPHWTATVAAGGSVLITTPYGGRLTVSYWNGEGVNKRVYVYSKASILCA